MDKLDLSTILSIILIIFGLLSFIGDSMFYGILLIMIGVGLYKCIIKKDNW